jgi:uncharacterized protein involved in exopolysaccharide biosynthesis
VTNDVEQSATSRPAAGTDYAFRVYPIADTGTLRLSDLWHTLCAGKWWLVGGAIAGIILAVAAILLITPRYRAETVILPVRQNTGAQNPLTSQLAGFAAIAGLNVPAEDNTIEFIATLGSRAFTEDFIQRHDLITVLFADDWNSETGMWDVDDPADVPTLSKAHDFFDKSVRTIEQDPQTGLVTLTIDWPDPVLAAEWANALVADVNAVLRARAIEQSTKSIDYLTRELESTSTLQLRTALFELMESQMTKKLVANVTTEYAFKTIDPAKVPEKVQWPNRFLFLALGLAFGAAVGLIIAFARNPVRTV